jgi:hypothetical protein
MALSAKLLFYATSCRRPFLEWPDFAMRPSTLIGNSRNHRFVTSQNRCEPFSSLSLAVPTQVRDHIMLRRG